MFFEKKKLDKDGMISSFWNFNEILFLGAVIDIIASSLVTSASEF